MRRSDAKPNVLLTGVTGFIGTGIRNALINTGHQSRFFVRGPKIDRWDGVAGLTAALGDLTDSGSIAAAVEGVSTVIHAASYIGNDRELQQRVNVDGTRNLVETAVRHQVRDFIYISTFGVYGGDLAAGAAEIDITPHPRSTLSASRWEAELIVLQHGGTVIRPALVHGPGDRWVIPPLVRLTLSLDAWIEEGAQLVSAISRDRLGELIVALADTSPGSGVFHAAHRDPIQIRQLAEPVIERLGRGVPTRSLTVYEAGERLRNVGISPAVIQLVTSDSWVDCDKIWKTAPLTDVGAVSTFSDAALDAYVAELNNANVPPTSGR